MSRNNIESVTQSQKRKIDITKKPYSPQVNCIDNRKRRLNGISDDSAVNVKIVYENKNDENFTQQWDLIKGQKLLTSYFKTQPKQLHDIIIDDSKSSEIECFNDIEQNSKDKSNLLHQYRRVRKKYQRINKQRQIINNRVAKFLVRFRRWNKSQVSKCFRYHPQHKHLFYVYKCIVIYHRFTNAVIKCKFNGEKIQWNSKMTTDTIMMNKRVQRILTDAPNNGREIIDENNLLSHNLSDPSTKRLPKNQRNANDNNMLMLLSENVNDSSEKDFRKLNNAYIEYEYLKYQTFFILVFFLMYSVCTTFYGSR